ncbi:MAG: 3-oxoacyl-[acyl-carrier-protein] reductase [Butyrivibrio sp.]|jgi:3-oxoacyl-[acyl-carrier protein] reductase|nr:3-oxoacyl-[acyl-carrier-protein] reductase [Butyrivibrio sp.]
MNDNNIKRCAVVTGGSRGIGRAICIELAKQGNDICVVYAGNDQAASETVSLCLEANKDITALSIKCDVSDEAAVKSMFETVISEFGRVDILVNNAGVTCDDLLARMSCDEFDKVININLRGTFICCQAVTRIMMKQRYGRIVNISSIVGVHGNAGQVNYSASKAGVIGLTKSIAKELASRNVTANAVAPGFIATDMTDAMTDAAKEATLAQIPLKRVGLPEDVAKAVAFLSGEDSSYITGQVLMVDGGMGC